MLVYVTGIYYCINMILIALSTTISAVVINMYNKKDKTVPVPQWFVKVSKVYFIFKNI